jgi:hypothetical protein
MNSGMKRSAVFFFIITAVLAAALNFCLKTALLNLNYLASFLVQLNRKKSLLIKKRKYTGQA